MSPELGRVKWTVKNLNNHFTLTDSMELEYDLEVPFSRSGNRISLSQWLTLMASWISSGLRLRRLRRPWWPRIQWNVLELQSREMELKEGKWFPYRSLIWSSLYLSTWTQLNIGLLVVNISRILGSQRAAHCLVIWNEFRKLQPRLVLFNLDQGCKVAIFQGCARIATAIGSGNLQPGDPNRFYDSTEWLTGRMAFLLAALTMQLIQTPCDQKMIFSHFSLYRANIRIVSACYMSFLFLLGLLSLFFSHWSQQQLPHLPFALRNLSEPQ